MLLYVKDINICTGDYPTVRESNLLLKEDVPFMSYFVITLFTLTSAGTQISAAPLGFHIEISASPLISAAHIYAMLIKLVSIFH